MSLSARFGLTITFSRPDRELYLSIVHKLASQYGINIPFEQLDIRAEAHAIRNGGRSPRVARQFIELTKAGVDQDLRVHNQITHCCPCPADPI